jgi:hypothetical protein
MNLELHPLLMGFGNVVSCFNVTLGQRCILDFRTVMHLRIYIVGACYPVVQACSSLCYSWLLSKWTEFCSCIASFFSFVLTVSHVIDYTGLVTNWNSIWIFSSTYDFRVYRSLNHLGLTGKDQRMRRFLSFYWTLLGMSNNPCITDYWMWLLSSRIQILRL